MTAFKFELDRTGFPMVWVEAINSYMSWLPITKIQFEYFLCAASDSHFNANWYDNILYLNPRVSPKNIRATNYWNAILTGIMPDEVQRFARWCGEGYSIPTLEEWFTAYKTLKALPPEPPGLIDNVGNLRERTRLVLSNLESANRTALIEVDYDRTLADQMLMRMGVMEWVECRDQRARWGGMGSTASRLHGNLFTPDYGQPSLPTNPDKDRLHYYGFRLIRRDR
jgi:hypothetical protein